VPCFFIALIHPPIQNYSSVKKQVVIYHINMNNLFLSVVTHADCRSAWVGFSSPSVCLSVCLSGAYLNNE